MFLPRPTVSNGTILVKLKKNIKCKGYVYFKTIHPHIMHKLLTCLKSYSKFYKNTSVTKGPSGEEMFQFFDIVEIKEKPECF